MLFSLNLNKFALVRNSRGKDEPSILDAAKIALDAGWRGLTIHPRADERHARKSDIMALSRFIAQTDPSVELNIECDLRYEVIEEALRANAAQLTLVPSDPGEITSTRGWTDTKDDLEALARAIADCGARVRVSLFVEAEPEDVAVAHKLGAKAVELRTEDYADAFKAGRAADILPRYRAAAEQARALGMRINLGHDLNLENLPTILDATGADEVSIGHAVAAESMLAGLKLVAPLYTALK